MSVRTKVWTREESDRLVAAGAFHPEARVQLIQGEIVEMTPQSAAHAAALVVEIADTTLDIDRTRKHEAHSRAQIPEYWIVNLVGRVLEV